MQLQQEIEDLRQQIEHLESALKNLGKPNSEAPTGNSLADALQARFAKLDSDVERQKSIEVTKTLLADSKANLERKQRELKAVGERLNNARSAMQYRSHEINALSRNLFEKLSQFKAFEAQIKHEWEVAYGLNARRLIEEKVEVVLPEVKLSNEMTFAIERFEPEQIN